VKKKYLYPKFLFWLTCWYLKLRKKKHEKDLPQNIYCMVEKMESKANRKFQDINMQRILTEATILDPRFKKKAFNSTTAYQKLILCITFSKKNFF